MKYQSFDPYHHRLLDSFELHTLSEIELTISQLAETKKEWRTQGKNFRAIKIAEIGKGLTENREKFALLISLEMGKPMKESLAEIDKCALCCTYYSENAEQFLTDEKLPRNAKITYQPLGIIFGIFPWNYPFWQVFRAFVPMALAGNVLLMKHAQNVPQCALAMAEMIKEKTGMELIKNVFADADMSKHIIEHPQVSAVTFTGSTHTGKIISSIASQSLKKSVLELGGSDPFIVTESADFDAALNAAITGRYQNNGQSCVAAKRFIIHESKYDKFKEAFVEKVKSLSIGDPVKEEKILSAMARPDLKDKLLQQINDSVSAGSDLLIGGKTISETMISPAVLENITEKSPAFYEELFGPVASLYRYKTKEEALKIANITEFGLGSAVYTNDENEKKYFTDELEFGMLYFNQMVKSSPDWIFGGIKQSGHGRELSHHGMMEFVNKKLLVNS